MSPSQPIRSLAAIVFTDIVGYSALVHRDDANAMRLVEEHFRLVREIAGPFSGRVIKTIGDSVHLEFGSAQAATACAIAVQQRHHQRNAQVAEAQRFDIRIGVHTGDVEHRGGDIYGDGVNIAARLQPLAPVGGIAISEHVRGQLREELRARFVSQGTNALKNIGTPVEVFTVEAAAIADIPVEKMPTAAPPDSGARLPKRRAAFIGVGIAALGGVVLLVAMFLRAPGSSAMDKSIAVLPFSNLSSDKEQEYFSDGVAEDVLNLLAKVPQLKVIARTSSFSYKGKDTPIAEIARALEVASVLQGSVRKSGNQVRIAVQLIRAEDSAQLWSETYDRKVDDIFAIQDEIASAVVRQLRVQLLGELPTAKPVDPKVYPLILQGDALREQGGTDSRAKAVEVFQEAVAIAPDEARAWAGLGRVYLNQAIFGGRPAQEGAQLAREAANKALVLDPANAMALGTLGRVASDFELDLPKAAGYYQRALELEPGNPMSMNGAASLLMNVGRLDDALLLLEYRAAHDTANPSVFHNLGFGQFIFRQWDAAIETSRTALKLAPEFTSTHAQIADALLLGHKDAAGALKEFQAEPDELTRLVGVPMALHALGRTNEADAALETLIEKLGKDQPVYVARVMAYRGDANAGFDWLDKGIAIGDSGLTSVLTDPMFDPLHADPRWLPFLRKIGYAPEQLAKIAFKVTLPQQAGP